jgi:UDP-2,4-diacetamido-2,4,6-trideoxy-beta-L-altropyranose hydrolase
MAPRPLLAVRADGGPGVGSGHVARGLALAEEWIRQGGDALLVTAAPPEPWGARWEAAGAAVRAPGPVDGPVAWWVADGYALDPADRALPGALVLTIDDHDTAGTGGAGADLVLDQAPGARAGTYPHAGGHLLGPRHALIRADVQARRGTRAGDPPGPPRVVVAIGGAPSDAVRAVVAGLVAHPALAGVAVEVLDGTQDAAAAFAAATVVVSAAGSTTWELCALGVPAVLTAVAPNQEPLATAVAEAGAAVVARADAGALADAASALLADPARRAALAAAGPALVDGLGTRRVVARLRAGLLRLRAAGPADAAAVHRWNTDPVSRAASLSPDPIPGDDHERWFAARLADPGSSLFVAADPDGRDIGLVRFQVEDGRAVIGVAVAPERRGERWGAALVVAGCGRLAEERGPLPVDALVREGNEASRRSFLAADFRPAGVGDPGWLRYVRPVDGTSDG